MQVEPATCPACGVQYDPLRARAVWVAGGKVRAFCSQTCKDRAIAGLPPEPGSAGEEPAAAPPHETRRFERTRQRRWIALAAGGVGTLVVGAAIVTSLKRPGPSAAFVAAPTSARAMTPPPPPPPAPPPKAEDALAALSKPTPADERELWVHPLPGPSRHLPVRNTRRFGAAREGLRPEECRDGHCGVDIGTEKGGLVICAHDGVVERVERDPELGGRRGNEGRFLRINHKGGTVVTSYMHLDGMRADLRPGLPVKAGEPLGTIGDTGVHASGPHLHFAVSVKATPDGQELFIDPEPLLHLWQVQKEPTPLKHPVAMEPTPKKRTRTALAGVPAARSDGDAAPKGDDSDGDGAQ